MPKTLASGGVYVIRHIHSGRLYVGSTLNFQRRWYAHRFALRRGGHENRHLQRAWDRDGEAAFAFEIVEVLREQSAIIAAEQEMLNHLRIVNLYNQAACVGSPVRFNDLTEEQKEQRRAALKGINAGRVRTAEERAKNAAWHRGRPLSAEHRQAIGDANRGKKRPGRHISAAGRAGLSASRLGRPKSDHMRQALSKAKAGIRLTDEHRAALSRGSQGKGAKQWPGLIGPDGTIYPSFTNLEDFARRHGLSGSNLHKVLVGKVHQHHGWRRLDENAGL